MVPLRIGLTISGAVALGAYEGGALAALLVAIKKLEERVPGEVVVDAIAGASAGSMTGVLAARGLLTDADPVELMYRAWVVAPALNRMRGHGPGAPLSVERIEETARGLLGPACPTSPGAPQQTPVNLQMALGSLRGLDYTFRRLDPTDPSRIDPGPLDATTYLDWYPRTFTPTDGPEAYLSAIEPALASGAHAVAFPPKVLSRAADRADYERNGVVNFPETGYLWYTDGGTIDNQPLGRALEMTTKLDRTFTGQRLHLLVIPDPQFAIPKNVPKWADPNYNPLWIQTLARAGKLAIAQSLYDDLRHAEKVNSRVHWVERLADTLADHLDPDAAEAVADLVRDIEGDRSETLRANNKPSARPPVPEDSLRLLLRRAIGTVTGLDGKNMIAIDAISPRILGATTPEEQNRLLAGGFLGHFGGFLEIGLRQSDFALGYRCMLAWLQDPGRGLTKFVGDPAAVDEAVAASAARLSPDWTPEGGTTLAHLGPSAWWQLWRVGTRALTLTASGLRIWAREQLSHLA